MIIDPYSAAELKGVRLPSRIVRSATHEGMADENGKPLERLVKTYVAYAKGGAGLIITGYIGISKQGKSPLYNMTMLDSDDNIPAFKALTDAVHQTGAPIFAQIAHCGRQTRKKVTGMDTVAPSAIRDFLYWENVPHALKDFEINLIEKQFVAAMKRAKEAGFDGVQLHCAHGYLLSEFLSPHTNKRKDSWGGNTEKRFRIVGEILEKARKELGDFPIIVKMNGTEKDRDGMTVEESVKIAKLMEAAGADAIEVSCSLAKDGFNMSRGQFPYESMCADNFRYDNLPKFTWPLIEPFMKLLMQSPQPVRNYNVEAAEKIKAAVSIPVIVVGGIRTDADIRSILNTGKADFVSMSRPFILEPDIVNRFKEGRETEAKCISCNYCLMGCERRPMRCYYGKLYKGDKKD